jgi:curved DNA-binding protein CbpA
MTSVYHQFRGGRGVTITERTSNNGFRDHYEALQLSPNADSDTIGRVYHILVKRYHPDNRSTGDPEKFAEVLEAHRVLSDPERRTEYDTERQLRRNAEASAVPVEMNGSGGFQNDRRVTDSILSLLYVARRSNPERAGMGPVQMERSLNCAPEFLEFHLWYLLEKRWIQRESNGSLAITASGVDRVIENEALVLRRDRLLAETISQEEARLLR